MDALKELKAAVLSLRFSGDPALVELANSIDELIAGLPADATADEVNAAAEDARARLATGLAKVVGAADDAIEAIDEIMAEEGYLDDFEVDEEVEQALHDAIGGGWDPDEYIAVLKSFSGTPITGPAAEQLIAALTAQARAVIGSFEVEDRNTVGNELYLRVRFDLDTVREYTGGATRRAITDVLSAGEVPGFGVVMCTSVVPLVPADVAATQRRGANALRDLRAEGRL